jgi:hypothetical protein
VLPHLLVAMAQWTLTTADLVSAHIIACQQEETKDAAQVVAWITPVQTELLRQARITQLAEKRADIPFSTLSAFTPGRDAKYATVQRLANLIMTSDPRFTAKIEHCVRVQCTCGGYPANYTSECVTRLVVIWQ